MPEPTPSFARRHPWLTGCGGLVGVLVLVAGFIALRIHFIIADRWNEFDARQSALVSRLKAQDGRREPLLGPSRAGNAWEGYRSAIEDLTKSGMEQRYQGVVMILDGRTTAEDLREGRNYLAQCRPFLERIKTAAACDHALPAVDWAQGWNRDDGDSGWTEVLCAQFALSASECYGTGHSTEAEEDLAVGLSLALDSIRPPGVAADRYLSTCFPLFQVVANRLQDPATQRSNLERLLTLLDAAERRLPSLLDLVEWSVALGLEPYHLNPGKIKQAVDLGAFAPRPRWKRSLSHHFLVTQLASVQYAFIDAAKLDATLPYDEWSRAHERIIAGASSSTEGRHFFQNTAALKQSSGILRGVRAYFAVLRAATAVRLGRAPFSTDWPLDPFNLKPIGTQAKGANVELRSVWMDGAKSLKGSWSPKGEDLVLEVPK